MDTEKEYPEIYLDSLDHLWFQVAGTLCNIKCEHCFISCSPLNHKFEFMTFEQVNSYLEESVSRGVKEYYFTGGEPFMNKDMFRIIEKTMEFGPATVLTNGMLITPEKAERLKIILENSIYSLELRVSIDGYTEKMNDTIRGKGVFKKAMEGVKNLVENNFLPIITVTKTWEDSQDEEVLNGFIENLKLHGYTRPRIKILPSIKIGQEVLRTKGYDKYEYVTDEMLVDFDVNNFICANSRVATNKGVYVCPILIDSPDANLGDTLEDASKGYELKHQACYTCYLYGAICSNYSSVGRDA
ncbi:MAG TPA: radical SAM protein [Ignavibacteriaceae bacterium]|nr:radical SAM protein [Ignavibacteriaceae bacterium]